MSRHVPGESSGVVGTAARRDSFPESMTAVQRDEQERAGHPGSLHASPVLFEGVLADFVNASRRLLDRHEIDTGRPAPQVIAVVSALRGEGVTTFSQALAATLTADSDRAVCWVDLSWAAPAHDGPDAPGLYELVTGDLAFPQGIQRSETVPRLLALHGGAVPPTERAALARSTQCAEIMERIRERCDHIVFDMPPILASDDVLPLMRLADAYVLVVRHGVTTRQQVRLATDELSAFEQLGTVLNRHESKIPRFIRRLIDG